MQTLSSVIFLLLVLCSCHTASEPKTINVTGQGKIKVVPDMVELSLRAHSVKPAMKDAVIETQAAVNEILAVCKKYMVSESDLKVSSISTNKAYDYRNGKEQFAGYEAVQVLNVTLKDISKIERLTEELLATKISRIDNITYNHSRADSIIREVNLMALEDARKTAEKMCSKMNATLGSIVYLSNFEHNQRSANRGMRYSETDYNMNLYNKSFGGSGFKMTTEILEFADAAYASFELH